MALYVWYATAMRTEKVWQDVVFTYCSVTETNSTMPDLLSVQPTSLFDACVQICAFFIHVASN